MEEHLMACCGVPVRPLIARRPLRQLAEYSINAKVSGMLQHTDFLKAWESHPDMLYARPLVEVSSVLLVLLVLAAISRLLLCSCCAVAACRHPRRHVQGHALAAGVHKLGTSCASVV